MKKIVLAALAATVLASGAQAASVFSFSFTSVDNDVLSGNFFADGSGPSYTVTGIDGLINGFSITGLSSYAGADQTLTFGNSSYFSMGGISFSASNGVDYNLTSYPDSFDHITNNVVDPDGDGNPLPISITGSVTAAVPEPATWAMFIGGFGLIGSAARRRKVAVSFA